MSIRELLRMKQCWGGAVAATRGVPVKVHQVSVCQVSEHFSGMIFVVLLLHGVFQSI